MRRTLRYGEGEGDGDADGVGRDTPPAARSWSSSVMSALMAAWAWPAAERLPAA